MNGKLIYQFELLKVKIKKKISAAGTGLNEKKYYSINRRYAGKVLYSSDNIQKILSDFIIGESPAMLARFGANELNAMVVNDLQLQDHKKSMMNLLCHGAGFFPCEESMVEKFVALMKESCEQVDYLATWNLLREEYYIKKYMQKDVKLSFLRSFEPWFASSEPWTYALKGKKVLVIHPFAESILKQYTKNREKLFENKKILPEFDLKVLSAVQTIAGQKDERFETWFDALEYMYEEAMKIDFDVALIGCGAYGFPLAAKLKKSGKKAVHMGGMLQILFGIKGKRWDDDVVVSKLYNEFWVRPVAKEKPQSATSVEDGCYW